MDCSLPLPAAGAGEEGASSVWELQSATLCGHFPASMDSRKVLVELLQGQQALSALLLWQLLSKVLLWQPP